MEDTKTKEYKIWEWDKCPHSPEITKWLKSIQGTFISEEEFVKTYKTITKHSHREPSRLRRKYRNMRDEFDFFGTQNKTGN